LEITFISKEEAGERLQLSTRRVLDLAKQGKIQSTRVIDPSLGKPVVRIHAGSVERYLDIRQAHQSGHPPVLPAEPETPAISGIVTPRRSARRRHAESNAWLTERAAGNYPEWHHIPLWLDLRQASAYSGLPAGILKRFVLSGELPALNVGVRRGGRWRIRRIDLEQFEAASKGVQ